MATKVGIVILLFLLVFFFAQMSFANNSEIMDSSETVLVEIPVLSGISNVNDGIKIKWQESGAKLYGVLRKEGEDWTQLGTTRETSYTDNTVEPGKRYTYTIYEINEGEAEEVIRYDEKGKTITYVAVPVLKEVKNVNGGVKVTWEESIGAVNYRVLRKVGGGEWERIGTTTKASYTDKTALSGTDYYYSVRCVTKDGKMACSGYDTRGMMITYIAAPVISKVTNVNGGVQITWQASEGAVKYRVLRKKTTDDNWATLANLRETTYTDNSAKSGTEYTYTGCCISGNEKVMTSGYDAKGKQKVFIEAPVLTNAKNVPGGVEIKWKASKGAEKYRVLRKTAGGEWERIAVVEETFYIDYNVQAKTRYTYSVRCVSFDETKATSGYSTTGVSVTAK